MCVYLFQNGFRSPDNKSALFEDPTVFTKQKKKTQQKNPTKNKKKGDTIDSTKTFKI